MIRVVTAIYGTRHLPFLVVLLESLRRIGVDRPVVVAADVGCGMKRLPGSPEIVSIDGEQFGEERYLRVSRKLRAWCVGLAACRDGDAVAFLDADTMVLRPLEAAFAEEFDVAYTARDGKWPVNSGVVFARVSGHVVGFFAAWRGLTEWVLDDVERNQVAVDHFGGADQAALMMAVAMHRGNAALKFVALPGSVWNETRCRTDVESVAIAHLKGCLQLLLRQRDYGPHLGDERSPEACEGLFGIWREMQDAARGKMGTQEG